MASAISVTQASGPRWSNSWLMRSRVAWVTRGSELNADLHCLVGYGEAVLHLAHARGEPSNALGFGALGPGPDRALQDDLAAVRLDGDAVGVDLGAALERLLDLPLHVPGLHL